MPRGMIHRDAVTLVSPGERVRDNEGRWKRMGDPMPVAFSRVEHLRRGEEEVEIGGRKTNSRDCVVWLPLGTPVEQGWKVEIRGVSPLFDDDYRIARIKDVQTHLRVMCLREDV